MICRPPKAVTFDAYNTLFNFADDARTALASILPVDAYEKMDEVWQTMNRVVMEKLEEFNDRSRGDFDGFVSMSDIHTACFTEAKARFVPSLDVEAATNAWNAYIAHVPLYDDAIAAVEWVAERYPTAIVSDIDTWMLEENPHRKKLPIPHAITSEGDASYKAMTDTTMFHAAAQVLGCEPDEIVHVGDSSADVIGVKRVGGRAIWLNRFGRRLGNGVPRTDAEIRVLDELPAALTSLIEEEP